MTTAATGQPGLRRRAIGLREVLFQSVANLAPGAGAGLVHPGAGPDTAAVIAGDPA